MTAPGPSAAVPPSSAEGHLVRPPLWLVFSVTLTGILANTLPNAPLPDLLRDFDQPESASGLFVAAGTLPGILMAPAIGLLADRYGRRQVLVPCLVAFSAFGVASMLAPGWGLLLAFRLLQGFGSAGLINLAVVVISDFWDGTERTRRIGWNSAVLTVSVAVLPAVGGWLAEAGTWRWAFAPYGLGLITAVGIARKLPAGPPLVTVGARAQLRAAGEVLRQPRVAASIGFGFVLFALIFGLFLTVLSVHLDGTFGLGAGHRGLVIAAPAAGATAAALLLGRTRARFGRARLLIMANVLFVIGFVVIGLADVLPLLLLGALCYGLGEGSAIPTVQDVVAGAAPPSSRGAVVAVWVGAARAGQTVGPLLAGVGIATVGTGTTFVLGGGVALAMLVAQLLLPRVFAERGLRSTP